MSFAQFERLVSQLGFTQEGSDYIGPCPICNKPRQYYQGFDQGRGMLASIPAGHSKSACCCLHGDIERALFAHHVSKASNGQNGLGIFANGANEQWSEPATAIYPTGTRPLPLATLLAKDFPPLVWLVPRLIAQGQLVLLGGRPKGGKSWLVLQLVQCVDTG